MGCCSLLLQNIGGLAVVQILDHGFQPCSFMDLCVYKSCALKSDKQESNGRNLTVAVILGDLD